MEPTVSTTRLEAFSDGVFAIAVTLLVLEIPRPVGDHLARELGHNWHAYVTYVVSFVTVGIIWVNHHTQLDRIARADRTLLFLNLLLLMFVSIIPFPTGILGDHLTGADAGIAAAVYSGSFLLMALSFFGIIQYATRRGLVHETIPEAVRAYNVRRNRFGLGLYVAAVPLAFVSAVLSLAICAFVAAFYVLPGRPPAG